MQDFLQRAWDKVDASLKSPPPAKLDAPTLEKILATQRERDEDIERRLRAPRLPTSLPPEDDAIVDDLLSMRGVISKCGALQIEHKDMTRLAPDKWLNDEIVNFYGQLMMNRAEVIKKKAGTNGKKKPLEIYYFNTFFWQKISKQTYEESRLDRWTKKFDIFAKDIVLIPINHNNTHWTAAAINFRRKRIESYDSMGMPRRAVFERLKYWLDKEHRKKKKGAPFDFTGWEDYVLKDTPQQENGYDCGVFTCQFLETLSRGEERFSFTQSNIPYLRRRMIWEIGNAKLRDDP
ncbi:cysteine proteinase [Fomitopsis betulina]|nr:cysteine proteinase [Fomitopsis betulina]